MTRIEGLLVAGLGLASLVVARTLDQPSPNRPVGKATNQKAPNKPSELIADPIHSGKEKGPTEEAFRPVPANPGVGKSAGSPEYSWLFEYPLPIPEVAQPLFTETVNEVPIQYYETTIEPFQKQVYPNLGPANLIGYGGEAPGATFSITKGTETVIRYLNRGNLSSAVHLHGSYTHSPWDGWAFDEIDPGQYKDYYYPNTESARSMWYHDHAHGHTAVDAYYGQSGAYYLTDSAEDVLGLPSGKYQVPLALMDKIYQANGDLARPDSSDIGFFGDIIEVNNQPWPYFDVEPRKYRFRIFDMALSRVFDIYFVDEDGTPIKFQIIGSDSGLFESPVSAKDFTVSAGERYEIVLDFAGFAGSNITMMNAQMQQPDVTKFTNTDKLMRFRVGKKVSDHTNNGEVPGKLVDIQWPPNRDTVDHEFNFQMGGADTWTINGVDFSDPNSRVLARPPQGTVERWRIRHTGGPAVHPIHIHLVNIQVLSRTGGARGLAPYEAAGLKDVVLLTPGESIDVLATYGPWNGMYMFHCHDLIHEDNMMMAAFNTTLLRELGYHYNSTQGFSDPMDPRFTAKDYDVSAFNDEARREKVRMFGNLDAYVPAQQLQDAQAEYYYATARHQGDVDRVKPSKTAAPVSSGVGFIQGVEATSTGLFERNKDQTEPTHVAGRQRRVQS